MDAKKLACFGVVCCAAFVLVAGCPISPLGSRTNNQGGGNLITAALKYSDNNLGALTADEIQIVSDQVIAQQGLAVDPLTDEQAGAIVQFMDDNNLNTIEDFQALENKDISEIVISDSVRAVLESEEVLDIIASLAGANPD